MQIKKAVRQKIWLKIAVTGATGSGKTYGALALAKGISEDGRVCVIDSENASASYYAGETDEPGKWAFDKIELEAPFTPQKYLEAIQAAIDADYKTIVIDSLTHEWNASGGALDIKAQKDRANPHSNSFTNWNDIKQIHNKFIEKLLQSQVHIIVTLRSKMAYVLEEYTEAGKTKTRPRKIGMAPISSDGMEYEFGVVFDVDRDTHLAVASKDRTGLFDSRSEILTSTLGRELKAWRDSGADFKPEPKAEPKPQPTVVEPEPKPEPEPKTAGAVVNSLPPRQELKPPISQEANDFVDAICEPNKEQQAENAKDEFIENVEFISVKQGVELAELIAKHRVPLADLLNYFHSKNSVLPTESGELRLDRLLADKFQLIHDILSSEKRRYSFITFLKNPAKTA
jgi:hypothetical protein